MNDAFIYILTVLKNHGGKLRDRELYENVKQLLEQEGVDLSRSQFNKLLMVLEVRGFIKVDQIKKNTRMVYLARKQASQQA